MDLKSNQIGIFTHMNWDYTHLHWFEIGITGPPTGPTDEDRNAGQL